MNYSKELKDALLRRMLPPNNESIAKISKEEGVSEQTLRNWRDKARQDGSAAPETYANSDDWSTQDKFLIVVESTGMNETELAEYARKKGLYVEQKPSTYSATAPNQVYMWDITYLNGPHKGMFYYLYLFSDLYDLSIVGWEVYEEESAEHASELIRQICLRQGRLTTQPLVLHSDNGSPMKGATMLATLYQLGITPSNSRSRVSNDNPYAESLFKTLKYRPNYQPQGFSTLQEALEWVNQFVRWYNYEHHHSGLKFLTPEQRRSGKSEEILAKRRKVYEAAKAKHPERWNGRATRDWSLPEIAYLNSEKQGDRLTTIADQKTVVS